MKQYEIYDGDNAKSLGALLYFEKDRSFVVELNEKLDEWTAPFLFSEFVKKGIYTIPREISLMWVRERIIPSGRQNIGNILTNHRLKEYNEIRFLELSGGRCSQDNLYVKKIDALPEFTLKRQEKNLRDILALDNNVLLCFFNDESVRKVSLDNIPHIEGLDKVTNNTALFKSVSLTPGGYAATFNNSIDISAWILHREGESIPLKYEDFIAFIRQNTLDTQRACEEMKCSRQNISYMIKQNRLQPVKENVKGNLYLRSDLMNE